MATVAKVRQTRDSSGPSVSLQPHPPLPTPVSRSEPPSTTGVSFAPSGSDASAPPSAGWPASSDPQDTDASGGESPGKPASKSIGPPIPRSDHGRRSTLARTVDVFMPPATYTPSDSAATTGHSRRSFIEGRAVHLSEMGSYTSAEDSAPRFASVALFDPPVTRARPSGSSTMSKSNRGSAIDAASTQLPVVGLKSSAEAWTLLAVGG